ncbi:MAG TPA: hypothetical protein VNJ51_09520 [Candidatus Dormibacteraeota bacterium]|nr:hypothetical protein [Candidatus Dormibacteraeota bacterium]
MSERLELPLRDQRALAKVLTALTRTGCTATSVRANFGERSAVITVEGSAPDLHRLSAIVSRLLSNHQEEYR